MKPAFPILCLILAGFSARAENVILNRIYFNDKGRMDFVVPGDELRKVRHWEPGSLTDAPLSRSQALENARKAAVAEGLDVSDLSDLVITLAKTNPFEKGLIRQLPPDCCCWYYLVDFKGDDVALEGKFTFLVSMSGAVAKRETGG